MSRTRAHRAIEDQAGKATKTPYALKAIKPIEGNIADLQDRYAHMDGMELLKELERDASVAELWAQIYDQTTLDIMQRKMDIARAYRLELELLEQVRGIGPALQEELKEAVHAAAMERMGLTGEGATDYILDRMKGWLDSLKDTLKEKEVIE